MKELTFRDVDKKLTAELECQALEHLLYLESKVNFLQSLVERLTANNATQISSAKEKSLATFGL